MYNNIVLYNLGRRQVFQNLLYLLLKISGALVIPKGNLRKQYLPKGVMKVAYLALLMSNGICQSPSDASISVKIVDPES